MCFALSALEPGKYLNILAGEEIQGLPPGRLGDANATLYNKDAEAGYAGYLAAEFTYPILPPHEGGADWFYSLPKHEDLCHPAEKIYADYLAR